jgi:hypothetical protein
MTKPPQPWWKKLLLFAAFALIALATVAVLVGSWISFNGRRDWARTKADLTARGEKLSFVELAPAPIPDAGNFFADPLWRELSDTVEVTHENGSRTREPRLAKGERQLDALDAAVAPETREKAVTLLTEYAKKQPANLKAGDVARAANNQLLKTADPAARRALGQLIIEAGMPAEPLRHRVELLAARPGAELPFDPSDGFLGVSMMPINYLLRLAQSYSQLAHAHLATGEPAKAAAEVSMILRLADRLHDSPFLISGLVRISIFGLAASTIDHGIVRHEWDDADLARFDAELGGIHIFPAMAQALRTERGQFNQFVETMRKAKPGQKDALAESFGDSKSPAWQRALLRLSVRSLIEIDQGYYNRHLQQLIDALERKDGVTPHGLPQVDTRMPFRLMHFNTASASTAYQQAFSRTAFVQNSLQQTRIACALERYRLKNGVYPDKLAALEPGFLPRLPESVITGDNFHYRHEGAGAFLLWSEGWNSTDDHGQPSSTKAIDKDGDWVWNMPGPRR